MVWRNCQDARPWLVVQIRPNNIFGCFPISSQCYDQHCFLVDTVHADFSSIGLTRACYIIYTTIYDLRLDQFTLDGKLQLKGELQGELLKEFRSCGGV